MKKLFTVTVALIMLFSLSASTLATGKDVSDIITSSSVGSLQLESAESIPVKGELVSTERISSDEVAHTYAYDITLPSGSGQSEETAVDDSVSIKAYTTVYWNTKTDSNGKKLACLKAVTGRWEILDNQVTVENCLSKYACTGVLDTGLGVIQLSSANDLENGYNIPTGFNEYIIIGAVGTIVSQTMTLDRGGSDWQLVVTDSIYL